jgi:nucleotide-binding universal stress UspA family protein
MKTIFAATDFSVAAHNASEYAASLASAFGARLILFSAYEIFPFPTAEIPVAVETGNIKADLARRLKWAADSLRLSYSGLTVDTLCGEGVAAEQIIRAAAETQADIIVTGMKQEGRTFRKIFGSTVTALLQKSDLPLIVVPEGAAWFKPDHIALANDQDADDDTDAHLLDTLTELCTRFSSKLYLVRIVKNQFHASYEKFNSPHRLMRMTRSLEPVYECFEDRDEERGLNEFVRKFNINMLVLLPHHHSAIDKWFSKSTTRAMVFESVIPLLILPGLRLHDRP